MTEVSKVVKDADAPGGHWRVKTYANVRPLSIDCAKQEAVAGHTQQENHLRSHDSGLKDVKSKLEIQREVNKELKRLLVASVGEELHHRFEKLVRERASLSHELGISVKQLSEGNEELEGLSIQCDVWRSKFIASRLMIDELANWKAALFVQHRECQKALQLLLEEHSLLHQQLCATNGRLKELSTAIADRPAGKPRVVPVCPIRGPSGGSVLDLANENHRLTCDIISAYGVPVPSLGPNMHHRGLTVVEQQAAQLVSRPAGNEVQQLSQQRAEGLGRAEGLSHSLSTSIRAFLSSREDHTDIPYKCKRCKGRTFVV